MVRFRDIKVEKRVHPIYDNWERYVKGHMYGNYYNDHPIIGKDHYIFCWKGHRISLIILPNYFRDGVTFWESCGGGITNDVVRYLSKKEAMRDVFRIYKKIERRMLKGVPTQ